MSALFHVAPEEKQYYCWDQANYHSQEDQLVALKQSATVYVGNLSPSTTELQIYEAFSVVGPINRIIMGLNKFTKEPCGFCFVEYFSREHANAALTVISQSVCDERIIRCDLDGGFLPGRQFGRGKSGGQRRDDFKERSYVYNNQGNSRALPIASGNRRGPGGRGGGGGGRRNNNNTGGGRNERYNQNHHAMDEDEPISSRVDGPLSANRRPPVSASSGSYTLTGSTTSATTQAVIMTTDAATADDDVVVSMN